ncbi:unnamed protein product [Brassica oleracea]
MMKNNKWKLILKLATVIHKDKDEEVNEDASKEPEKVKEKKQGKRKKGWMEEVEEVNEDALNVCGKVKKKKMQVKKNIPGRGKKGTQMRRKSNL